MIPFFSKIRRQLAHNNQFFKYSRYAIGQIVLVMVGILLALQVNNWNENRKEQKQEIVILKNIKEEINLDTLDLGFNLLYHKKFYKAELGLLNLLMNDGKTSNQFLKNSRYAIGEIILVVLGILIALQLHNWNENRKEQKQEIEY